MCCEHHGGARGLRRCECVGFTRKALAHRMPRHVFRCRGCFGGCRVRGRERGDRRTATGRWGRGADRDDRWWNGRRCNSGCRARRRRTRHRRNTHGWRRRRHLRRAQRGRLRRRRRFRGNSRRCDPVNDRVRARKPWRLERTWNSHARRRARNRLQRRGSRGRRRRCAATRGRRGGRHAPARCGARRRWRRWNASPGRRRRRRNAATRRLHQGNGGIGDCRMSARRFERRIQFDDVVRLLVAVFRSRHVVDRQGIPLRNKLSARSLGGARRTSTRTNRRFARKTNAARAIHATRSMHRESRWLCTRVHARP